METKIDASNFKIRFLSKIDQLDADQWNLICGNENPFIRHEFLSALEQTGCVEKQTGWEPYHALVYQNDQLCALMPLYIKHHSYGEYVFDWAWADAYHRHRVEYYPKLLTAIPFTPSTGPRICVLSEAVRPQVTDYLIREILKLTRSGRLSSWHLLFPDEPERSYLDNSRLSQRIGCQFHWFNKDYSSFEHFLAALSSRKRKMIRRERKRIAEQGLTLEKLTGEEIGEQHIRIFYQFYQATYFKHAQRGYLTHDFFKKLQQTMPDQLLLVIGYRDKEPVAGALSLIGKNSLYGRYWGCLEEFEYLHFEACFYQGIEFCIEQGLGHFDPGAQGEHKISRGFEPITTYSFHYIADPAFKEAIDLFLKQERQGMTEYAKRAEALLPFKKG